MSDETPFEPETDWDGLIEKMGKMKAALSRMQRLSGDEDVPVELTSQIAWFAGDFDTFCRELIAYEHGGEMPDECPVCGEPVVAIDELQPGESYAVDRMCIKEQSADGIGHGLVHFDECGETPQGGEV